MCVHVICACLSLCAESSEEDVPMEFGASESEVRSTLVWRVVCVIIYFWRALKN